MAAMLAVDPVRDGNGGDWERDAALGALLLGRSVETTPALAGDDAVTRFLAPGTRVFVPWLPDAVAEETIAAARALRERGMVPVPHLAARRIPDAGALDRLLRRLRSEAAVAEVLVVGGDVAAPVGPFESALQLLETGLLGAHGIAGVGVGGYPEGHHRAPERELLEALLRKQAWAARAGHDMFVVTQFAFRAAPVVDWLGRVRASGLRPPIHVGVPGPARIGTLVRYARMCGIGPSWKLLLRHGKGLAGAARVADCGRMVLDLAAHAAAHPEAGLAPLHIYPFGGLRRAADWIGGLVAMAGNGARPDSGSG